MANVSHHNKYLLKFVEPVFEEKEEFEEIIGWEPAEKVDLEHLNFMYECADPVKPIIKKGVRFKPNQATFLTKFDTMYNHYKKWCQEQRLPFLLELGFWKEVLAIFPYAQVRIKWEEFIQRDKDGKDMIDKKGNRIINKVRVKTIWGIQFHPDGIKKVENHPRS